MLSTPPSPHTKRFLLDRIREEVIRTKETDVIIADTGGNQGNWLLDFRRIFLNPDDLDALSELFWDRFASQLPFQIGGMESASLPLITALVLKGKTRGTPIHGFYIRKSRKKTGLLKQIEGNLGDEPIVLVDDLINNGNTFLKQIVLLEALGKHIQAVFAVVRFNDLPHYTALADKHIQIETLFDLNEVGLTNKKSAPPQHDCFSTEWYFRGGEADLYRVERKSTPATDEMSVYFGTDNGYVYALAKQDGSERWKFKVGLRAKGQYAISDLFCVNSVLYFASKNGNVFALDATTGKVVWVYSNADWCTSSVAISLGKKCLYVGINAGWFNKRNFLVALDMENGAEVWRVPTSDSVQSVTVDPVDSKRISIGCADGTFSMLHAKDGLPVWSFKADGPIIGGSAHAKNDTIVFGSLGKHVYMLNEKDGTLIHSLEFENGVATTPLSVGNNIIVSGLDKYVYCIAVDTAKIIWTFETKGRIFADPVLINDRVYVGSDDSRLYEIDLVTGKSTAIFQTIERITNPVLYAPDTEKYFLTTYANELYCLTKKTAGA